MTAVAAVESDVDSQARGLEDVVGQAPAMQELFQQIELVAATDVTVLTEGETGTGKDLVARTIHCLSSRSDQPFVAFNASNLQEQLFESELFGHVKGSFSGAHDHHEGLARAAHGGTLFIDEVGELPAVNQAKLLRFLDTKEVRSVGSTKTHKVDVRIVCATNRDLQEQVRAGEFREDLYYRLKVITLTVPPLRDRMEDLPLLVDHFLRLFCEQYGKDIPTLSREARELLKKHFWRGNVRELENEIERAVVMTPNGQEVPASVLSSELRASPVEPEPDATDMGLKEYRQAIERRIILETLDRTGWNVSAASRELDISRVGLTKKLKRLGIERPDGC